LKPHLAVLSFLEDGMDILKTTLHQQFTLYYPTTDTIIGGQIAQTDLFEPYEETLLLDAIHEEDVVVDIGANIGVYTLQMAQKVGPRGCVYAFEPEPTNYQLLQRNIAANGLTNVQALELALADFQSKVNLYLSWDNIGDHRIYDANYRTKRNAIEVSTATLDQILLARFHEERKITAIKCDTQGFEPFVLKGAQEIIRRDRPTLLLEYWPFAYEQAHADVEWMLDFLLSLYPLAYTIDGRACRLLPLERDHLNDFTRNPGEEEGLRNLLFMR
jgi:FkbM family methyltransferase